VIVVVFLTIGGARTFFTSALENNYRKDEIVASMQLLRDPLPYRVHKTPPVPLPISAEFGKSKLEQITASGRIRVGYVAEDLPFAYFNTTGELVGFDVEIAHSLARDLDVELEFVPVELNELAEQLNRGSCDIVMSGIEVTHRRAMDVAYTRPYLEETFGFIVKDHRRNEFNSREAVQRLAAPRIGVPNIPYYIKKLREYLPRATLVPVASAKEFFQFDEAELDALAYPAEAGSAWSLLYPAYTVVIPHPDILSLPIAYPVASGDHDLVNFLNTWIELKKRDQSFDSAYDYWILGKNTQQTKPRWSAIRDVLHWVD